MQKFTGIISDRASKYAVSGGAVETRADVKAFMATLCRDKKFAKATHNSWAAILRDGPAKGDDGEAGAGMVILRMLQHEGLRHHIIVVTRWYGGVKLGGDRFRHVQTATRHYLRETAHISNLKGKAYKT